MPVIDDGAAAEGRARVVASEEGGLSCTAFAIFSIHVEMCIFCILPAKGTRSDPPPGRPRSSPPTASAAHKLCREKA